MHLADINRVNTVSFLVSRSAWTQNCTPLLSHNFYIIAQSKSHCPHLHRPQSYTWRAAWCGLHRGWWRPVAPCQCYPGPCWMTPHRCQMSSAGRGNNSVKWPEIYCMHVEKTTVDPKHIHCKWKHIQSGLKTNSIYCKSRHFRYFYLVPKKTNLLK